MLFEPNITLFLRDLLSCAGEFFKIIGDVGDIPFFVAIIFAAYWTSRKREAILRVGDSLFRLRQLLTEVCHSKSEAFEHAPERLLYEGVEATNFSTPSGHAQIPGFVYGWIPGHPGSVEFFRSKVNISYDAAVHKLREKSG